MLYPRIDDALASLRGNQFFTSLDLFQGFYQLPLGEKSKFKSAFTCDEGLFHWNFILS